MNYNPSHIVVDDFNKEDSPIWGSDVNVGISEINHEAHEGSLRSTLELDEVSDEETLRVMHEIDLEYNKYNQKEESAYGNTGQAYIYHAKYCIQNIYYVMDAYVYIMSMLGATLEDEENNDYKEYFTPYVDAIKKWEKHYRQNKNTFRYITLFEADYLYRKTYKYELRLKILHNALGDSFRCLSGSNQSFEEPADQLFYVVKVLQSMENYVLYHYDRMDDIRIQDPSAIDDAVYKEYLNMHRFIEGGLMDVSEMMYEALKQSTSEKKNALSIYAKRDAVLFVTNVRELLKIDGTEANKIFQKKRKALIEKNHKLKMENKAKERKIKDKRKKQKKNRKNGKKKR